jgi:hypothetical protein
MGFQKQVKASKIVDWIVAYLIPTPVWRLWRKIRHPISSYKRAMHLRWALHLEPGDMVCDCRGLHLKIVSLDEKTRDVYLEDGAHCDPAHCCDRVKLDGSCHSYVEVFDVNNSRTDR